MATEAQLLDILTEALSKSTSKFNDQLPAIEKQMYEKVLSLLNELEVSGGKLKVSVKNIRIIGQIKRELNKVILTPKYRQAVDDFINAFDTITDLQTSYFDLINSGYKASSIMLEIKKATIEDVKSNMLDVGINYNVSQKVSDILRQQITSGGKFTDLVEGIRKQMLGDGEGALQRYAKTYANDSLYTYSRQYHEVFASDLSIEWYRWHGSIMETSRPFCVAMNENTRAGGCLEYIHVSQFDDLLKGHICSDEVALGKKTKLPEGFKKNTTVSNFATNAGGWNCEHMLIPTPTAAVPKKFLSQIK